MAKRQFRIVTGLTGLLVATGVSGLLGEDGRAWVGSAYAQDSESWEEDADAEAVDESGDEGADDSGDGESTADSESTEDGSVVEEEESAPVEESGDSETPSADDASAAEPVAEEPEESESAPEAAAEAPSAPSPQEAPQLQPASNADRVRQVLIQHTREVVPGLDSHDFKGSDSLRALGANSIDRSEIVMLTLETLDLKVPMIELAKAENLDELARLIASKMP